MFYFLRSTSAKNYRYRIVCLNIIASQRWDFFNDTVYTQCSFVDDSAKLTDQNEITPESNYVSIGHNGTCVWEPRYELSVSQCTVDITWFPFDKQVCDLAFESWIDKTSLHLVTDNYSMDVSSFLPPDAWHLVGTFRAGL